MITFNELEVLNSRLDFIAVGDWLSFVIKDQKRELNFVNFIFCSDPYLLKINQDFLNHDYLTDVITFDYNEEFVSSDVFISVDRVDDNAKAHGVDFTNELMRVIVHGVLHLCGFKDKTVEEERMMRFMEDHYLNLFVSRET
jgi:rRNA maturation RNase YbeY